MQDAQNCRIHRFAFVLKLASLAKAEPPATTIFKEVPSEHRTKSAKTSVKTRQLQFRYI